MQKARRAAAPLAAAAAVTTVVGSAQPLFRATFDDGPSPVVLTFTPWRLEVTGAGALGGAPANGYPLVFAAVVLVVAAFWCRSAARPGAPPRTLRVAGVLTAVGATFLVCTVWLVTVQVAYWADMYGPQEVPGEFAMNSAISYPAGLWVLGVAALLGVAAVVPAFAPGRQVVVEPVDPDAPTPPFGIALPVDEPLEPEPPAVPPQAPPPSPKPLSGPAIPLTDDPLAE